MTSGIYWTFEYDGEIFDLEMESEAALFEYIDNWWAEKHSDEEMKNGETREDTGFVVQFTRPETPEEIELHGDMIELSRAEYPLSYEYYHGDFAEHNTHWGL